MGSFISSRMLQGEITDIIHKWIVYSKYTIWFIHCDKCKFHHTVIFFLFLKDSFLYLCVCLPVCMCICIWVPLRPEEGVRVPRARDRSESPDVDSGNRTPILWQNSKDSLWLNDLSRPPSFSFLKYFLSKLVIQYNTKQTTLWEMDRMDNNLIYGAMEPLLRLSIHKDMSVRLVNDTSMLWQTCGQKHHHTVVKTFANHFQHLPILDLLTKQPLRS